MFLDQGVLEEHFNSLCNTLPDDYQLTIAKLMTMPHLLNDDGVYLSKLISSSSSSTNVRMINENIITYLIAKLCYSGSENSLLKLCDVMDELSDSTDSTSCVQQVRRGM